MPTSESQVQSKKSEQTKRDLVAVFVDLLRTRPLNEISITDITKRCGVNRNTFYYHFNNVADLIEFAAKDSVDELVSTHPPRIDTIEKCLIATLDFARKNHYIINNIYRSASRVVFERHLWHVCEYYVSAYMHSVYKELPPTVTNEERAVLRDFLKFECFGFVIDWINHDMPADIEPKISVLAQFFNPDVKVAPKSLQPKN